MNQTASSHDSMEEIASPRESIEKTASIHDSVTVSPSPRHSTDEPAPPASSAIREYGRLVKTRSHSQQVVDNYLAEQSPEFRRVSELRQQGWETEAGDQYFTAQKHRANTVDAQGAQRFFAMMLDIATQMHTFTGAGAFRIPRGFPPRILDFCMAPGGFMKAALDRNPDATGTAFSLPPESGGHRVLLAPSARLETRLADITMFAADMGVAAIPPDHPDAARFHRAPELTPADRFDLVFCDGNVLRTHEREAYRESREARRLTTTQLALGLEHLKEGGTMVVLLHGVDHWAVIQTLYRFQQISHMRLFKPPKAHKARSSFYLIAQNVAATSRAAVDMVTQWKQVWEAATFGDDEKCRAVLEAQELDVGLVLREFGDRLVKMSRMVWKIQANALEKAPWMTEITPVVPTP